MFSELIQTEDSLSTQDIADLLWPNDNLTSEEQRNRVKAVIFLLRSPFSDFRKTLILTTGSKNNTKYKFNRDFDYDYDIDNYWSLFNRSKQADNETKIKIYEKIANNYNQASNGFYYKLSIEKSLTQVLLELANYHKEKGNYQKSLHICDKVIGIDSSLEQAHRMVIEINKCLGETNKIEKQFRFCEKILKDMNLKPDTETINLYQNGGKSNNETVF